ncbi:MAG: transposase [Chitinispirillaceae bacterium]|nr:transposase [Chitinispirillaceae bacterium]
MAYAERFIRSVREETLDWFVIFTETQLRRILSSYISYFNTLRPHQGINQNIPSGYSPQIEGPIRASPVLNGFRCHFYRKPA